MQSYTHEPVQGVRPIGQGRHLLSRGPQPLQGPRQSWSHVGLRRARPDPAATSTPASSPSKEAARPLAAPPHRDSRPMLPARESGALRTARRRTGHRKRPRYTPLPGREAALSGGSSYSGGSHPSAANENRTSWRRRQKEGKGASEAASSS